MLRLASRLVPLAAAALSACMVGPTDDHVVARRDELLAFEGFHLTAGAEVSVDAFDFVGNRWQNLGSTLASTAEVGGSYFAEDVFQWRLDRRLDPDRHWQAGAVSGFRARVRSTTLGQDGRRTNLMSVEDDWTECLDRNRNASDFSRNCQADHRGEAWLYTADYCNDQPAIDWRSGYRYAAASLLGCDHGGISIGRLGHAWDDPVVRLERGGRVELLRCEMYQGAAGVIEGHWNITCRVPFGPGHLFADAVDYRNNFDLATLQLQAVDPTATTCGDTSPWTSVPWPRRSLDADECRMTTPPPKPPMGDGPDLVAESIETDVGSVHVRVVNKGNRPAGASIVKWSGGGNPERSQEVPALGVNEAWTWWLGAPGALTIRVSVDADADVAERDETNNTISFTVEVAK